MRRTAAFSVFCMGLVILVAAEELPPPSDWLSVLPRADRSAALKAAAAVDTAAALYIGDREDAAEAERVHALRAYRTAAGLDAGTAQPSAESAQEELQRLRRLRWESAADFAGEGYRSSPGGDDETLARKGRAFAEFLSPRIGRLSKTQLKPMADALAMRMARHPDTPKGAFSVLRESAELLDAPGYRTWILALAEGTPRSFVGIGQPVSSASEAAAEFSRRWDRFLELYAARMLMRDIFPAAAAASWYVDGPAGYGDAPAPALASIGSFLRNLSGVDPVLAAAVLMEDPDYGRAYLELGSILWVLRTRMAVGMEWEGVDVLFSFLARSGPRPERPSLDYPAVLKAEAFAATAEETPDDEALLLAYGEFRQDGAAHEALLRGARYRSLRDRLSRAAASLSPELDRTGPDPAFPLPLSAEDPLSPASQAVETAIGAGLVYLRVPRLAEAPPAHPDALAAVFAGSAVRGFGGAEDLHRLTEGRCAAAGVPAAFLKYPVAHGDAAPEYSAALRFGVLSVSAFRAAYLLGAHKGRAADAPGGLR